MVKIHPLRAIPLLVLLIGMATAQELRVRASVDSTRFRIGEWIPLTLTAETPGELHPLGPSPGDTLGPFEVLRIQARDSSESDDRKRQTWLLHLTTFDTGAITIPPIAVHFLNTADGSVRTASTDPIALMIGSVDLGENAELKDIKPPLNAPWLFEDFVPYLLFLAFLAVLTGAYLFYRRYRRKAVAKPLPDTPSIPAHELALMALKELEARRLWQQGKLKAYYSEITEILRRFFERRFGITALEMTSDEILRHLREKTEAGPLVKEIDRFLLTADLVKFAKYVPSIAENDAELQMAYSIVRGLIPRLQSTEDIHAKVR
ncbi:MAG: DUF4381 family protein [Ignavibacteriales bacterium]|nr:DUF4381 family protein [Ignavibacteriales bacterium]